MTRLLRAPGLAADLVGPRARRLADAGGPARRQGAGRGRPDEPAVPSHAACGPSPGSLDGPHAAHDRRPVLAQVADLDGDGLEDLWGSVDGKLRAFRAEPPEAWRSLDGLVPAGDLDGDGIADAMTVELRTSAAFEKVKTDSRTAVARSGRDGRVLWTRPLDDAESPLNWDDWLGPQMASHSTLSTFPLPAGDLDGDGAPEVVVVKREDGRPWPPGGPRPCRSRCSRGDPAAGSGRPVRCQRWGPTPSRTPMSKGSMFAATMPQASRTCWWCTPPASESQLGGQVPGHRRPI